MAAVARRLSGPGCSPARTLLQERTRGDGRGFDGPERSAAW